MSDPGEIDSDRVRLEEILIETALDAFRFHRVFLQLVRKLDPIESQRYISRAGYFLTRVTENLTEVGLSLKQPADGEPYDPGMAVSALNIEDFDLDEDQLVIEQTLEPIILNTQGIRRMGTVMLRKEL